jgi:hypothetical protein
LGEEPDDAQSDADLLLLGPMLRHVTETSATIWVETAAACAVEVLGVGTTTFTVGGHHYALVVIEGLSPATVYPYDVRLDGRIVWPSPESTFPLPCVRTLGDGSPRVLFGSCRAAAPHEPPYSLELDHDERGRGVDALRAHGLRMLRTPIEEWPDLLVLLGDQVYADDPSPRARRRIRLSRRNRDEPPDDVADGFEQYTWLYREAWTPEVERWMFSVVPSTMIFDDHDMIDDWNISNRWVADIRGEAWWEEHIVGGLTSYWVYQHLGNLSPERIAEEGMLAEAIEAGDAEPALRRWAMESEHFTPVPGGYHFSFHRRLGDVVLVVIDSRNGRVLDPADRRMVDDGEWQWVCERAAEPCRHLLIGTSLPTLVPGGLHDFQQWNEALCTGRWGRLVGRASERIRRSLDLEDWPAFHRSFVSLCELLSSIGSARPDGDGEAPITITMLSGDIHFAYVAGARFPDRPQVTSRINQVVSSPIRNALVKYERTVIRFSLSRFGRSLGRVMRRSIGRAPDPLVWELDHGPYFANNIGLLTFDESGAHLTIERARPDDDGEAMLELVVDTVL